MRPPHRPKRGFSLVEVLVSLTLLGLAGSTLLLATASTVQAGGDALAQTIARGIAEQLIDDVLGQPYIESGGNALAYPLGRESGETTVPLKTILFDDSDDYHQYTSTPPRDPWGCELGTGDGEGGLRPEAFRVADGYFVNWNVEVTVQYADESNPTIDLVAPATSGLRSVTVRITRDQDGGVQELVTLRQVFAYVPPIGS
ncbi:MAG: prepilin-type N-terminal cleavage/methylation domain-containing protein [Pirellulaceae bacterium]